MKSKCLLRLSWVLIAVLLMHLPCIGNAQERRPVENASATAHELRRDWVRRQLPRVISDDTELAELNARLNDLNPFEINELANEILDALQAQRNARSDALWAAIRRAKAQQAERNQQAGEVARSTPIASPWGLHGPINPYASFYPPYVPVNPYYYYHPGYGFGGPPIVYYPGPAVGYMPIITWLPQGVSLSASAVGTPDGRHVRTSLNPFFSTIGPVHTFNYGTGEYRRVESPPADRPRRARTYYDGLRTRTEVPER